MMKITSVILLSGWSPELIDFGGSGYSNLGGSRVNIHDDDYIPFAVSVVEPMETP